MPSDAEDDLSLAPTNLDKVKLEELASDGRMEAENGTWIVLRYPELPEKGPRWCPFTLIINHPKLRPRMSDFKNLQALVIYLGLVERERLKMTGRE